MSPTSPLSPTSPTNPTSHGVPLRAAGDTLSW
jgi:hypothetical protein